MRKLSNENLCPRYPGRQWKQMFTFKGNKFDYREHNLWRAFLDFVFDNDEKVAFS